MRKLQNSGGHLRSPIGCNGNFKVKQGTVLVGRDSSIQCIGQSPAVNELSMHTGGKSIRKNSCQHHGRRVMSMLDGNTPKSNAQINLTCRIAHVAKVYRRED